MKNMWLLSSFILSLFASPLFSDQINEKEIAKSSLFAKSQKKGPCSDDKSCTTCCPSDTNYRLPSDFNGINTFAEYLVWQVQEQASHFVVTPNEYSTIDLAYPNTEGLGTIRSLPFKWGSGIRVGMGYTMARDSWQALGQYTWFATEGKKSYSIAPPTATTTEFLMPTFYAQSLTGTSSASGHVQFSYQMADLLAARDFLVTERIQLNFAFGPTGGYIKEDAHFTYSAENNTYVHNNWSFGGGGFRTSLASNWHIGYGFGLCGRVSFAAILGSYANLNRITADAPILTTASLRHPPHMANSTYQGIMLMPTSQFALGFDWCRSFAHCSINAVKVSLMGEFNNLPNLQQAFRRVARPIDVDTTPAGNQGPTDRDVSSVYMYGANFRLGLDY